MSWGSSVSIVTKYELKIGVRFRDRPVFLFVITSRQALDNTHSPTKWVPGQFSWLYKKSEHEANHKLPSDAEVKNDRNYTPRPPYIFRAW